MAGKTDAPLADRECVPCRGGVPPMEHPEIRELLRGLDGWEAPEGHHLEREFRFVDFRTALGFVDRVGAEAERWNHHPDLELSWGRVGVRIFTHRIDGLSESDFVLAAKIDRLYAGAEGRKA